MPDSAPGVEHFYRFGKLLYREQLREKKLIQNKSIYIYILNQNFKNYMKIEDLIKLDDDDIAPQRMTTPLRLQLLDID